jgi:hypothetical protein
MKIPAALLPRYSTLQMLALFVCALALLAALSAPAAAHRIRIATFYVALEDTRLVVHAPLVPLEILSDTIAAIEAHERSGVLHSALQEETRRYFDERMEIREGEERLHFAWMEAAVVRPDTQALEKLTAGNVLVADSAGAVFLEIRGEITRSASPKPITINAFHLFERPEDPYPPLPVADISGPGFHEVHPFDGFAAWHEPGEGRSFWLRIAAFLGSGIWHIFTGYDHVLFLLGLHLVSPGLRETLKIVTAFTVSHTITLTLAATGVFTLSPAIVEPAIALTIVYVGVENLWKPHPTGRWITAFFFGFIHGFGFAGALGESLSLGGLDRWAFAAALLSFNLGVEVGQAAVVTALAPFWVGVRWVPMRHRVVQVGSLLISLAGAFWFVTRVLAA